MRKKGSSLIFEIEGPDLAGKTTLADRLEEAYRGQLLPREVVRLHLGSPDPPDRSIWDECEAALTRVAAEHEPADLIVQDRWAMGDVVYGPLLRGTTRLSPDGLLHCEMLAEALGAVRLMMLPPLAILRKRYHTRGGDDLIDETDLAYLHTEYTRLAARYGYPMLRDVPDLERCRRYLAIAGEKAVTAACLERVAPGYVGTLTPLAVLAGDVRSGSDSETEPPMFRPAFLPSIRGSSASYLMDALATSSRTVIKNIGILNTGEPGVNLRLADEMLKQPQWVALGHAASRRLDDAGIEHQEVPHPQWQRRFKHGESREYATRIMNAALPHWATAL